jgi:hypothetical protein
MGAGRRLGQVSAPHPRFSFLLKKSRIKKREFWEELIAYCPIIRHRPHRQRRIQQFFVAAGTWLPLSCNDWGIHKPADSPLIRHGPHRKRRVQQFFVPCIGAVTCIPSRWLSTKGRYTYTQTDGIYEVCYWDGIRCHDIRVYSYIPSFVKIGSGIQKLIHGHHRRNGDRISILLFFKIRREGEKGRLDVSNVTTKNCKWNNLEHYLWRHFVSVETFRTIRKNIPRRKPIFWLFQRA